MLPPISPRYAFTGVSRFPCHVRIPAYLLNTQRHSLHDEWEQECPECGALWRFVRDSLVLTIVSISERTQPAPAQQTDPLSVEARMLRAGREYLKGLGVS